MQIRILLMCVVVCCLCTVAKSQGVFTYQNDSRRCSASFGGNGSGSAYDEPVVRYGVFQGGANLEVNNGMETWAGHSDQMSSMDSTHMFMMGGASATVYSSIDSALTAQGQAKFDVWFTSSVEAPVHFCCALGESGYITSVARVTLTTWAGATVFNYSSEDQASRTFSSDFTLPAGNYRMVAEATARVRIPPGATTDASAMCSFLFEVVQREQCRADLNSDGEVNSLDFFIFLNLFLQGNADFNGDGITGSDDFFVYMRAYLSGCP